MASYKEPGGLQNSEARTVSPVNEREAKTDHGSAIIVEDINEEDLEMIGSGDFVEAHTLNMDDGEIKDDDYKLIIDEDFDSDSDTEEQQSFLECLDDEIVTKEQ